MFFSECLNENSILQPCKIFREVRIHMNKVLIKKGLIIAIIVILCIIGVARLAIYSNFFQQNANSPPKKPKTPTGLDSIDPGFSAYYQSSSSDPDNDSIRYGWDWNGDSIVDEWTKWYESNQTIVKTIHQWETNGTFYVKVKTQDIYGAESEWSNSLLVTVNFVPSFPNNPNLSGPTSLVFGEIGTYYAITTIPDGFPVRYYFLWGDRTYNLTGFVESGLMVNVSHVWNTPGNYTIVCEAENEHYYRSHEAILNVVITEKQ